MAHKKAGGSTRLGRNSASQRLGVKLFDGQFAQPGAVLVRQRGTRIHPGNNVKRGNDDTLFSIANGFVKFYTKKVRKYNNSLTLTKFVQIIPAERPANFVIKRKKTKANVTPPTQKHRH